jgi:hypothetical protein
MKAIEVDPETLRRASDAAINAGRETVIHNQAEVAGSVPGLIATLSPHEPYGYMLMPEFLPGGAIRLPIASTREEVRAFYEVVRGRSDVLSEQPLIEVRGTWYAFWETISTGRPKGAEASRTHPLAVLTPVGVGAGIDGEIIWPKLPMDLLGVGPARAEAPSEQDERLRLFEMHNAYLRKLATADVEAILTDFNDGAASAVRDYVGGSGRLIHAAGIDEHRAHFQAFFDRFEILEVEFLHRVVQTWYVFAELRFRARDRAEGGRELSFNVADIHGIGKDGRVIARLSYGTDPT